MNQFYNPVRIFQGRGARHSLGAVLQSMSLEGKSILLLVREAAMLEESAYRDILTSISEYPYSVSCMGGSNPGLSDLMRIYSQAKEQNPGLVIAIGGGSVLDVGKSLCCILPLALASEQQLREVIAGRAYPEPACRWIGIPTTAGTGSEVTCWATIWDKPAQVKLSVESRANYAYAAFADPDFLEGMPVSLEVSSALDAMTHAAEAYWAKATNYISRSFALESIRLLTGAYHPLTETPRSPALLDILSKASLLAGLAFSNTKTTACHSISYPLTMKYGIPHGVALSILLAPMLDFNMASIRESERLLEAFGVRSPAELGERIRVLLTGAGLPARLQEWGARVSDFPELSGHCFTKGRMDNNPAAVGREDIRAILTSVY